MDDYWTVAIFGVDSRNGNIGKGTSADTQMLLTLNRANGEIRLVSVYRDTLLMSLSLIHIYGKLCRRVRPRSGYGRSGLSVLSLFTGICQERQGAEGIHGGGCVRRCDQCGTGLYIYISNENGDGRGGDRLSDRFPPDGWNPADPSFLAGQHAEGGSPPRMEEGLSLIHI